MHGFDHAADAVRRVGRIDVTSRFSIAPSKRILLPLLPALLIVVAALWANSAAAMADTEAAREQVKESTKKLAGRLADRRKLARELGTQAIPSLLQPSPSF